LGIHGTITPDEARIQAKKRAGEVANQQDPVAERERTKTDAVAKKKAATTTVNFVLDQFVARHAEKLRSAATIKRSLDVYVRPQIGKKSIYDLKRLDVVTMLDAIEDADKAPTADRVLAYVRKAFNWYATRDENFLPPIVKGMTRTRPSERARTRMLADDEIRSLWQALKSDEAGPEPFRRAVRVLLLTAQRLNEIGLMKDDEIDGDTLVIPAERYKTGVPNAVPLTAAAYEWIGKREGYIFSTAKGGNGKKPFSGWGKAKRELDTVIARQRKAEGLKEMPAWRLHDLRRTARSLMSRAGVPTDIAEMVLGHKLQGVRATYDRHSYANEKRQAVERLAVTLDTILHTKPGQPSVQVGG
jgi:integrase